MQVLPAPERITTLTAPKPSGSACPLCGAVSSRVHSHYTRILADLSWQGWAVTVQVRARRFRCGRAGCPRQVFAERLPEMALSWARRTARLGGIQRHIGLALGGEPGSRLATRLAMPVSGDTLLRLVRAAELLSQPALRVVGIDEWAWRRGLSYGTIVCGLLSGSGVVIWLVPLAGLWCDGWWASSKLARARSFRHHGCIRLGQPFRAGGRRQVLRAGAPASLARGRVLPRLRQSSGHHHLQGLGHVLAELGQLALAARARGRAGDHHALTRQVRRQRPAHRLAAGRATGRLSCRVRMPATQYRAARTQAFQVWAEVSGGAAAA